MHAIPLALATLSTFAAANNSDFEPLSLIFGPPCRALPCCPVPVWGPAFSGDKNNICIPYRQHSKRHNAAALKRVPGVHFGTLGRPSRLTLDGPYVPPQLPAVRRTKRGSIPLYRPRSQHEFHLMRKWGYPGTASLPFPASRTCRIVAIGAAPMDSTSLSNLTLTCST